MKIRGKDLNEMPVPVFVPHKHEAIMLALYWLRIRSALDHHKYCDHEHVDALDDPALYDFAKKRVDAIELALGNNIAGEIYKVVDHWDWDGLVSCEEVAPLLKPYWADLEKLSRAEGGASAPVEGQA